jgi:cellulose synthase/poly-beta-1,6-N-acetylglucosamine synthase-like glycosyltransferase
MLMKNPTINAHVSILGYLKCTSYFGFSVFCFINLGFLVSEFVKSKQKKYSFISKFEEISSIKTSKEKMSIVLDSLLYFIHSIAFFTSYIIGSHDFAFNLKITNLWSL